MPRKTTLGATRPYHTTKGRGLRNRNRPGIHSYKRKMENGHRKETYDRPAIDYTPTAWAEIVYRTAISAGGSKEANRDDSTKKTARFQRRSRERKMA